MKTPPSPLPASTRRRFLMGTAGACVAVGTGIPLFPRSRREWFPVRRCSQALGAEVDIRVWHRDRDTAESALDAAFAELELVESVMSLYRADSEVSRLNRTAALENPHPHLVTVLRYASEISARTQGAFDVTIQPLWELYREARKQGRLPDDELVRQTRGRVGWQRVQVSPDRVALSGADTAVTLNGIAQGFAADAALASLRRAGVHHAMIDAGEIGALGAKPDGDAWWVGIQHPRQRDAFVALAKLRDRCLATSGDYETRFSEDFVHHHLLDPRTGRSPAELASVSIAAPGAMAADALSTAVFVLGPDQGMELVRSLPGVDALLVLKGGRTLVTDGFPVAT